LPAVPAFIVGPAKPISGTIDEAEHPNVLLGKLLEHERIEEEAKDDVVARYLDNWFGRIRLRIPSIVELLKGQLGSVRNRPLAPKRPPPGNQAAELVH
jgi:hypothetical protein